MARKRFRNRTKKLQVFYDEKGQKRELVPRGTVVLDQQWGRKLHRILEPVASKKTTSKS